jgi:hypothetical protein
MQVLEPCRLDLPRNWGEVADRFGASTPAITRCRKALDRFEDPITDELVEEIRRMLRFCEMRNAGGGGSCTRQAYVRLRESGELTARLKTLGII